MGAVTVIIILHFIVIFIDKTGDNLHKGMMWVIVENKIKYDIRKKEICFEGKCRHQNLCRQL